MSGREGFIVALMALSLLMIGSPWLLGFSGNELAAISACGIGGLFILPTVAALLERYTIAAGAALTLGSWSLLAPILLGFAGNFPALTAHLAAGLAAMLLAVTAESWRLPGPPEIRV